MNTIHKTIADFKDYLDGIDDLSKSCSPEQKKELNKILQVQLTMMVCLRKSSKLGEVSLNFLSE